MYGTILMFIKFNSGVKQAQAFISFIVLHYPAYIWAPVCIWAWL